MLTNVLVYLQEFHCPKVGDVRSTEPGGPRLVKQWLRTEANAVVSRRSVKDYPRIEQDPAFHFNKDILAKALRMMKKNLDRPSHQLRENVHAYRRLSEGRAVRG